jgi:hypothetical protein
MVRASVSLLGLGLIFALFFRRLRREEARDGLGRYDLFCFC